MQALLSSAESSVVTVAIVSWQKMEFSEKTSRFGNLRYWPAVSRHLTPNSIPLSAANNWTVLYRFFRGKFLVYSGWEITKHDKVIRDKLFLYISSSDSF